MEPVEYPNEYDVVVLRSVQNGQLGFRLYDFDGTPIRFYPDEAAAEAAKDRRREQVRG